MRDLIKKKELIKKEISFSFFSYNLLIVIHSSIASAYSILIKTYTTLCTFDIHHLIPNSFITGNE